MLTVKATYRGETRKLPSSVNTFPSYEQLCNQFYRVFPISHNYYFSRLLFSPNAAQGGRILIGREVRSADDYNRSIGPYKDRSWPQGLLRFAVYDETPHKMPSAMISGPANGSPWPSSYNATNVIFTPMPSAPVSTSHIPTPPMNYTSSAASGMDIDTAIEDRKRKATSISTCCSARSTKQEIQNLMAEFKEDLDRILEVNFHNGSFVTPSPPLSPSRLASDICPNAPESSPICSICAWSKPCSWFTCGRCHIIGCFGCSNKNLLCLGSAEHHQWNYTPMPVAVPRCFMTQGPLFEPSRVDSLTTPTVQISRNEGTVTPTVPFIPPPQTTSPMLNDLPGCYTPLTQTVVHKGVLCDSCENIIEGVRHKCLDCSDYDLCTGCITSGGAERHSPFHEFFEITEPGRVIVHTVKDDSTYVQGSAQETATNLVSHFATCDLCDSHIQGDRYKCLECPDFDTCSSCFRITELQHPQHTFARIRDQGDLINRRPRDKTAHYATCNICTRHIFGIRFKCMHPDCPDFDLCGVCEAHPIPLHPASHALLKMRMPDAFIPANFFNSSAKSGVCEASADPATVMDTPPRDNISCENSIPPEGTRNPFMWGCMQAASASGEPDPQMPSTEAVLTPLLAPRLDEISPSITRSSPSANSRSTFSVKSDKGGPSVIITQPQESDEVTKLECQYAFDGVIQTPSQQGPDKTPFGTPWPSPANDLAHLMQLVSLERENPPTLIHSQVSPVDSPLTGEALLARPSEEHVKEHATSTDMQQKLSHPVTLTHRTLSMLLGGSRSPSTVQTMSSVTSLLLEESKAPSQAAGVEGSKDLVDEKNELEWHNVEELVQEQTAVSVEKGGAEIYYGAKFIEDVTVPEGQVFPPGAEFMKCWRVLNDSDCDWPETTELVHVAGEKLGVEKGSAVHVGQVKAGAEVDLWTGELKAPDVAGRYVSYWRLRDGKGRLFGGSIWIDVVVADALSDESDRSIASSLVVMPRAAPERSELSVRVEGRAASTVVTLSLPSNSTDGIGSDADSDISLVSTPSSDAVWEDVASSLGDRRSQTDDYILLYDDRSSEDE